MMLTTEQQNVFDWLNDKLQVPVFAEAYKGALVFLDKKPPGYITFVAHAGRDLMNRLAATVSRHLIEFNIHNSWMDCKTSGKQNGEQKALIK